MPQKQLPLKQFPLRVPGQSADEAIERLTANELAQYVGIAVCFFTLALLEWYRYFTKAPYAPIFMSIAATIVIGYSLLRSELFKDKSATTSSEETERGLLRRSLTISNPAAAASFTT